MHGKLSFLSQLIKCSIRHTDQYSMVSEDTCGTPGPPYCAGILQPPRGVWKGTVVTPKHNSMRSISICFQTSLISCKAFMSPPEKRHSSCSYQHACIWPCRRRTPRGVRPSYLLFFFWLGCAFIQVHCCRLSGRRGAQWNRERNVEGVLLQWKGTLENSAAYDSWSDTLDGATIVLSLDRFTKQTQTRVGMLNSNPAP